MSTQGDLFAPTDVAGPKPSSPRAPAKETVTVAPVSPVADESAGPRVLTLVDVSGFVFRAYHALPPLSTSKGVPTHAVLGFTRMLLKLMREKKPTYLALCFDKDSRKGRLAIDPTYKANRDAPPPDISSQFTLIREVAGTLNVPIIEYAGWEADDVIATLAKKARAQGYEVEIIASDKDFFQIVAEGVRLWDPAKEAPLGEAEAMARYGVPPSKMRDYLALVGDAIDNVAKVPGIGPKTAVELLNQFGSIEVMLGRLDEVKKPKVREALKTHAETLDRARKLIAFQEDLPLDVQLEDFKRKDIHQAEARALFTQLEFFRLLTEMPQAPAAPLGQSVELVTARVQLEALASKVAKEKKVALAPAWSGRAHSADLLGLAVALPSGAIAYVDARSVGPALAEVLGPPLSGAATELYAHDGKSLLHQLWRSGIRDAVVHTDVELLSYLINPSRKEHALADLARERLNTELPVWPGGVQGKAKATLADVPVETLAQAFGAQADAVLRLKEPLWTELETVGLGKLAREMELPLIPLLARLEQAGVLLDRSVLEQVTAEVEQKCEQYLAKVYALAGREFNVGSPPQLAQVLYQDLGLPVLKRNKTGPSTDQEVLEKLAEQHPLPGAITEYRQVAKLKSTWLDTLPELVSADGRVRTTLHQAEAATGRLSSTDPNMQNIPIRSEAGKQIRRAFVAPPGWSLVSADYSQVELRILAHIAGDEGLLKAFQEEADVHARTAAEVFSVHLDEVTAEHRRAAKMVNYGIAYGLSAHGLSTRLNIPVEEAAGIIERYFQRYPGIHRYLEETVEKARKSGYVETLFGRRRYMPDLVSKNRNVAMAAERAAINMPIQGTAADLMKLAMLDFEKRLPSSGLKGRMLLQVHDELLFESPEGEAEALAALARESMSGIAQLKVPLVVDVGWGKSWADAH
jgi:DNA polymerase I